VLLIDRDAPGSHDRSSAAPMAPDYP